MRHLLLFLVIITSGCVSNTTVRPPVTEEATDTITTIYSKAVADSFSIFIKLPPQYDASKKYPVIYVLDANFYFDMLAATVYKYADMGAIPPQIVVGIGYKDFETMDKMRDRDYTYPEAAPSDSFEISGGGAKFLKFISTELIPYVDTHYSTTSDRTLIGHSLGGFFTVYALQQDLLGKGTIFNNYIAASPAMHYGKYSLLSRLDSIPSVARSSKPHVYITYGGLEDSEDAGEPGFKPCAEVAKQFQKTLGTKQTGSIIYKYDIYSAFYHMDMAIPSFTKGLLWMQDNE